MENKTENTTVAEVTKQKRKRRTAAEMAAASNASTELKRLKNELTLANNKIVELTKIIEGMKGQTSNVEQQYKSALIKSEATQKYVLDCIKHAYIAVSMAVKEEN